MYTHIILYRYEENFHFIGPRAQNNLACLINFQITTNGFYVWYYVFSIPKSLMLES